MVWFLYIDKFFLVLKDSSAISKSSFSDYFPILPYMINPGCFDYRTKIEMGNPVWLRWKSIIKYIWYLVCKRMYEQLAMPFFK